jgi:transcriptional regulator with XRE-family HTH domain
MLSSSQEKKGGRKMESNGLHERIKAVRKSLVPKVSQTAFAEMLGTTRAAIAPYERGIVTPSDTFIQLLCAKFNISEEWLRTGAGSMHKSDIEAQVDAYTRGYTLDAEEREIIRYFLNLNPSERAAMIAHVENLADAIRAARPQESAQTDASAANSKDAAVKSQRTMTSDELEAKVDAYRAALIAEQKGLSASSSGSVEKRA